MHLCLLPRYVIMLIMVIIMVKSVEYSDIASIQSKIKVIVRKNRIEKKRKEN